MQQPEEASWQKASGGQQPPKLLWPVELEAAEGILSCAGCGRLFSSNLRAAWPSNLLNRQSNDVTGRMLLVPGKTTEAHRNSSRADGSLRLTDAAAPAGRQNPKNRPPKHLTYLSEFTHQVATVASVTCGSTSLGPTTRRIKRLETLAD